MVVARKIAGRSMTIEQAMKAKYLLGTLLQTLTTIALGATVEVDPYFQGTTGVRELIKPGQVKSVPVAALRAGDQVAVRVEAENAVYNDLTACVVTEAEARNYSPKDTCRGRTRVATPFIIEERVAADGNYVLMLDNSYAGVITKKVSATISHRSLLPPERVDAIKRGLLPVQAMMLRTFVGSDFNIFVKPCGQSNAFSDNRTANITLCSEFIHEMAQQGRNDALVGVLLHEYGHSLLNRWGEPGASEEDMADQFATAMLLREGDQGRRMLQGWIAWWSTHDSAAQARHQIQHGDTHSLSVQRARNIQHNMNYPEEFTRRWNKMLYRYMTREAIEQVLARPRKTDDVDIATAALRAK
jgi:Putative metallopeptidase